MATVKSYDFDPRMQLKYEFDINTIADVEAFLGKKLKSLERDGLEKVLERAPEEVAKGFSKNQKINFTDGTVALAHYPVWMALNSLGLSKKPTGLSLSVKTADGLNVAIRRSLQNGGDRGCLGCVAGFLRKEKAGTINELVLDNLFGDAGESEEVGFSMKDTRSFGAKFYVDVQDQDEIIGLAQLNISSEELIARRDGARGAGRPNQLVERDLFFLTDEQVRRVLPYARGAAQHLAALIAPQLGTPEGDEIFAAIRIPEYDRKEIWEGLVLVLNELGIPNPLF
ncbi:MAG: hypothetical protein LBQ02_02300 [Candidatus Nomurabacteria bacterium]|jgi:hypothetical protein|nr:hypothetical protein [Candidatus Nomurabacteria bacterium]